MAWIITKPSVHGYRIDFTRISELSIVSLINELTFVNNTSDNNFQDSERNITFQIGGDQFKIETQSDTPPYVETHLSPGHPTGLMSPPFSSSNVDTNTFNFRQQDTLMTQLKYSTQHEPRLQLTLKQRNLSHAKDVNTPSKDLITKPKIVQL